MVLMRCSSTSHLNLFHEFQPIGGVLPRPLSRLVTVVVVRVRRVSASVVSFVSVISCILISCIIVLLYYYYVGKGVEGVKSIGNNKGETK